MYKYISVAVVMIRVACNFERLEREEKCFLLVAGALIHVCTVLDMMIFCRKQGFTMFRVCG